MTQPSTSDTTPQHPAKKAVSAHQDTAILESKKHSNLQQNKRKSPAQRQSQQQKDRPSPVITHPNFDPSRTPIDPARPLTDIPEPAPRCNGQLQLFYRRLKANADQPQSANCQTSRSSQRFNKKSHQMANLSKWALIESAALADHLALLSAGQLIELPASFYSNHSDQPLLAPLSKMTLLDMADIRCAMQAYPTLTRYGLMREDQQKGNKHSYHQVSDVLPSVDREGELRGPTSIADRYGYDTDELLNSDYADDWEVILHPERFDSGEGSLATDVIPCSVMVHALKQCETRKSINTSYSATDLSHYLRSYVLSQIKCSPLQKQQYRQIRIFAGHVIVAAHYLGWSIQQDEWGHCYFNISSRCGLLSRYPNMNDYHINGWSSQLG